MDLSSCTFQKLYIPTSLFLLGHQPLLLLSDPHVPWDCLLTKKPWPAGTGSRLAEGPAFGDGDLHLGKAPRGDPGNAPTRWALETFQKKPEGGGRGKRGAGVEEGTEKSTGRGSEKAMLRRTAGEHRRETPGMGHR